MSDFNIDRVKSWVNSWLQVKSGDGISQTLLRAWLANSDSLSVSDLAIEFKKLKREQRNELMNLVNELVTKTSSPVMKGQMLQLESSLVTIKPKTVTLPLQWNKASNTPSNDTIQSQPIQPDQIKTADTTSGKAPSISTQEIISPVFDRKETMRVFSIYIQTLGWWEPKELYINEKLWTIMRKQENGDYYLWDTIQLNSTRNVYFIHKSGELHGRFTIDKENNIIWSQWMNAPKTLTYKPHI